MITTEISQFGRILGSLFYYAPSHAQNQPLLTLFASGEWQNADDILPLVNCQEIQPHFANADLDELETQFQRLFIGPDALPAPPWGSVYLDKEEVIFGESVLTLRHFLQQNGLAIQLTQNEPEDHFGLMLMIAAYFAEQNPEQLPEFLAEHFLPWAYRFLQLLQQGSQGFYLGLAILSEQLLQKWQQQLMLTPKALQLYR